MAGVHGGDMRVMVADSGGHLEAALGLPAGQAPKVRTRRPEREGGEVWGPAWTPGLSGPCGHHGGGRAVRNLISDHRSKRSLGKVGAIDVLAGVVGEAAVVQVETVR